MMESNKPRKIEWMCTRCGMKTIRSESIGRPMPGKCLRGNKSPNGGLPPHSWVINRVL